MDEILNRPRTASGAAPRTRRTKGAYRPGLAERFTQKHHRLARFTRRFFSCFSSFNPMLFLALATVLGIGAAVVTTYVPSYQVLLDGQPIGVVASVEDFEGAVGRVEDRAAGILGHPYEVEGEFVYNFALSERDSIRPASTMEPFLFDRIGDVMKSYVLSINGEVIGASDDRDKLTGMLSAIQDPYRTADTVEASFVDEVHITREYISADVEQDLEKMQSVLTTNTNGQTTYEVQAGDTFMALAFDNGMDMDEMEALNPGVDVNTLMIGQVLNIKEEIPFLSVRTVDHVTYTEPIPSPVRQVEDGSMYRGDSKVLDSGTEGTKELVADVTYVNGHESQRDILSESVLTEPTEKVIAVGTKERPSWLPNGYFIWPVHGHITSGYGPRTVFGSYNFHRGIDIAVPYGTSIAAADGGTVIWAGWKGSYGKLVIIDHGDGRQTYYGHNSSLLVSAGDKVYQGQTIARAGSTGRSTGNHCHFEVHVNGQLVNPMNYL